MILEDLLERLEDIEVSDTYLYFITRVLKQNQKKNRLFRIYNKNEKKSENTACKSAKDRNQCSTCNDHTDQQRIRHAENR